MYKYLLFFTLIVTTLMVGCDSGGSDNNFNNGSDRPPRAIATLTGPTGTLAVATPAVPYSFVVRVGGVVGVVGTTQIGSFDAVFSTSTGSVTTAGLGISFSPLVNVDLNTYESVGTVSGPFLGDGTTVITVTYTEPGVEIFENTLSFTVTVPPYPTSFTFSPDTTLNVAIASPDLVVTVTGDPAGGTVSLGNIATGGTGGTFITGPAGDQFTFTTSSTTAAGTATVDVTYTPAGLEPSLTLLYTVVVSDVAFSPMSPLSVQGTPTGSPAVVITATGSPAGGVVSLSGAASGGTGGSFNLLNALTGTFNFVGATTGGAASVNVTYTPPTGLGAPVTMTYVVNVTSMSFSPATSSILVGGTAMVTATGLPAGGSYTGGGFTDAVTGGTFSTVGFTSGSFSFTNPSGGGAATAEITYTPLAGAPITLSYTVNVSGIGFAPASPLGVTALPGGSAPVTVTAVGSPSGGTYGSAGSTLGAPGGVFAGPDSATGEFTFAGATSGGTSTINITYTPPLGSTITATYTINATGLTAGTPSPLEVAAGGSDTTVFFTGTAGGPGTGAFSFGATSANGTGGTFLTNAAAGSFTFTASTATASGVESIDVTFTPTVGLPVTLTHDVIVSSIAFLPSSPQTFRSGDLDSLTITALGGGGGGTFSNGTTSDPSGTGGTFSAVDPVSGVFTFSGADGEGDVSVDITYTPLDGTPATRTFTVNVVTALRFSPINPSEILVGAPSFFITAVGSPAGGTYTVNSTTSSVPATGGSFSGIDATTGVLTFDGSTASGFEAVTITYTPAVGTPVTETYTVFVTNLIFMPEPSITYDLNIDTLLSIGLLGGPDGGTFLLGPVDPGTTGGTWTLASAGPTMGTLEFAGATTPGGTATATVTYVPPLGMGAPISRVYTITTIMPFASCENPLLPITDFTTTVSTLDVVGGPSVISDVNIGVNILHTFDGDLDITVTSPAGTIVELSTDNGSTGDNMNVVFDDEAGTSIVSFTAPGGGASFRPEGLLSSFDGENSNGTWTLNVADDGTGDTGTLVTWCVSCDGAPLTALAAGGGSAPAAAIPDSPGGPLLDTITLSMAPTSIDDVNVRLDISHTFTGDLDITLTSPSGTVIDLTSGNGGGGVDLYSTVNLDDEAVSSVTAIGAAGGTFIPEAPLSTFDGENANGDWTLSITDTGTPDTGTLNSWFIGVVGPDFVTAPPMPPACSMATTTTENFTSSPAVAIPDNDPTGVSDTIMVTSANTTISDVDVGVDITHTFIGDMEITLTSPMGTSVLLQDDNGGGGDNMAVTYNDEAATPISSITSGMAPFSGMFAPLNPLSAFDGEDPNGTWTLTVVDDQGVDTGTFNSWFMDITGCAGGGTSTLTLCSTPGTAIDNLLPPTVDTIMVAGSGTLTDVNISVDISHTWVEDMDITVTSPTGTVVELSTDNGGSDDDMVVVFDDEAGASITTFVAPGGGASFAPEGLLSDFDGEDGNGGWTLTIVDDTNGDSGTLNSWCVILESAGGGAPALTFLATDVGSGSSIPATDIALITDSITVAGSTSSITDLRVMLDIDHVFIGDMDISIMSPSATSLFLYGSSSNADNMGMILSDTGGAAATTFPGGNTTPYSEFLPDGGSLATTFGGEDANGMWMLIIVDTFTFGSDATLNNWGLAFNGAPFPAPFE